MRQAERTKHCFLSKTTASGGVKEMAQKTFCEEMKDNTGVKPSLTPEKAQVGSFV